jgi:hypothetical protein
MTTKETLDFYASVILPSSWPKAKKNERVVEVLDAVGLGHGHKTLVRRRKLQRAYAAETAMVEQQQQQHNSMVACTRPARHQHKTLLRAAGHTTKSVQ